MLVKDYMTRHPSMAEPNMSVVEAQRYMWENGIRHLPVVGDGKRLLGLVTRQTLLVDPGRLHRVRHFTRSGQVSRTVSTTMWASAATSSPPSAALAAAGSPQ